MILSMGMSPIWRQYGCEETEIYSMWKECGFRAISYEYSPENKEVWFTPQWEANAAKLRSRLEQMGIQVVTSRAKIENPFADEESEQMVHRAIACAGAMGIPGIVIPLGYHPGNTRKEYEDNNLAYLGRVLKTAEEANVILLLEHAGSFSEPHYTHHAIELSRMIEKMKGNPFLKVSLNMSKMGLADIEPYTEIHLLGDLIKAVELSDNFGAMDLAVEPRRAELGLAPLMGYLNFDELMQGLKDIGYNGIINMNMDFPREFPRENPYGPVKLARVPLEITKDLYRWVYKIGKHILESYDCYEG